VSVLLSQNQNLQMLIHNPRDEAWLYLDTSLPGISPYFLTLKGVSGLKYIDVRLTDTITISKNTKDRPCSENPREETYFECFKSKVNAELINGNILNCSTWLSNILQNWPLPECKTQKDFVQTTRAILQQFYSVLGSHESTNCYLPCNKTTYSAILCPGNPFNISRLLVKLVFVYLFKGYDNLMDLSDIPVGYVKAFIYFESEITEIKSEAFLVDFGNLVSSIGGSLGLF